METKIDSANNITRSMVEKKQQMNLDLSSSSGLRLQHGFIRESIAREVKTQHSVSSASVRLSKEGVAASQSFSCSVASSSFEQKRDAMTNSSLISLGSRNFGMPHSQSSSAEISLSEMAAFSHSKEGGKFGSVQNFRASVQTNEEKPTLLGNLRLSPVTSRFGFLNFQPHLLSKSIPEEFLKSPSFHINETRVSFASTTVGSIRTSKDQMLVLRRSTGASESESEGEDDDDETLDCISFISKPAIAQQPQLAITDKPHYEPSESGTITTLDAESIQGDPSTATPEHKKHFKVAKELLTSEQTYVKILRLVDQEFYFRVDQENKKQPMNLSDVLTSTFCSLKSLYKLHHDHLLPTLEKRINNWDSDPRIGDIMKDFAPFLKMYSQYVQNFDQSVNIINLYREKCPRFAGIMNEVEQMEMCCNLPLQHHLIAPIQRIPRYKLLLEAYLRRLPEDSNDLEDTKSALDIVSQAADHSNEAMRKIVGYRKLLEVQERVRGIVDLISPSRLYIREGKVTKISSRTGDHQERYLFLLSDLILLCSHRPMTNRIISNAPYQLRAKLEVACITVAEGDDLEVKNSFYIQDNSKKIELYTDKDFEKVDWMQAIYKAKEELLKRKSSLRLGSVSPSIDELGAVKPPEVKTDSVSKCMDCNVTFGLVSKRKKHCYACGSIVCSKCSDTKMPINYDNGKSHRVCNRCKLILLEKEEQSKKISQSESFDECLKGVLDVPASTPSIKCGYLNLKLRGTKGTVQRWAAIRDDFVLYCYEKETDNKAQNACPIPGMVVQPLSQLSSSEAGNVPVSERSKGFRILHSNGRKCFIFLSTSEQEAASWIKCLTTASHADASGCNEKS